MVELNSTWEELAGGIGGGAFPELGTAELPDWLQAWYDAKAEASQIVAAVQSGQAPPEALRYVEQIMSSTGGDYDSPPESAEDAAEASGLFDGLGDKVSSFFGQSTNEPYSGNFTPAAYASGNPDFVDPSFMGDIESIGTSLLDGAKGLFNSIGTDEYNAPGILESIISNPLSISGGRRTSLGVQSINEARGRPDMGAKFAAYAPSIAARLMGGPAMALGLFGGALNAAGAYHDFDSSKDSNAFFDPATGMVAWGHHRPRWFWLSGGLVEC